MPFDDVRIELVEEFICESIRTLRQREQWWIDNNPCCNQRNSVGLDKKDYYEANKGAILSSVKANYEANKETILAREKNRYKAKKETILARVKANYEANKEAILARKRAKYQSKKK
jgi:hypothetical protein